MKQKDIIKILNNYKSVFDDCISPEDFKKIAKDIMELTEKETKNPMIIYDFWGKSEVQIQKEWEIKNEK